MPWYYNQNNERIEVTIRQLLSLAENGEITPDTQVEIDEGNIIPARRMRITDREGNRTRLQFCDIPPQHDSVPDPILESTPPPELVHRISPDTLNSASKYFYYDASGQQQGPVSNEQLKELVRQGIVTPGTPVITEGSDAVREARQMRHLFANEDTKPQRPYDFPNIDFPNIGFTRFITNTWISFIWFIVVVGHFLALLVVMTNVSQDNTNVVFLMAILVITLISLLYCRMNLEHRVIVFRIETNTRATKEYLREIKELLEKK